MTLRDNGRPVYEPIVPPPGESFVWRRDDYPLPWSVWNHHPECEVHLILRTTGTCYIGDHVGSFVPGSLYLVGGHLPHNWVTPLEIGDVVRDRDVVIQFDGDRFASAAAALPELGGLARLLGRAARGLSFHGRAHDEGAAMVEAMGGARGPRRLSLLVGLLALMSDTDECAPMSSETYAPNLDDDVNRILRLVMGALASRLHEDLTLADMAALAGMGEASFSRFFRRNTGNTFTRHLGELRVSRACRLLAETDRAVTDVCSDVGYANLSNFNRIFRELRGMTPRDYRRLATSRPVGGPPPPSRAAGQKNTGSGNPRR